MSSIKDHHKDNIRIVTKDGLDFVEFLRISEWNPRHSPNCTVCNHEKVGEIEHAYMDWATNDSLLKKYGLNSKDVIARHFVTTGLRDRRMGNRRQIFERIVEKWMQSDSPVDVKDALSALTHLDKLDGKVIDRSETTVKTKEDRDKEYADILKLVPKSK